MADIAVPASYRNSLTEFARLPDEVSQALLDALSSVKSFAPVRDIEAAARGVLDDDGSNLSSRLIPPLLSLRGQIRDLPATKIADRLSNSADLDLDEAERQRLAQRVASLLDVDALKTTAVGIDLLTQHARNFATARIYTDIRPLFLEDPDEEPTGAVIVETLQLETWSRDGETETLYIAMDEADLLELQETIRRALKKTGTARKLLRQSSISCFDLDERES